MSMNNYLSMQRSLLISVYHSAMLMGLLCDLLESSYGIQQQFLQSKGFLIISYLLEKVYLFFICVYANLVI